MSHQIPRKAVLSFSSNILITSFGLISLIFVKRYYGFEAVGMIAFSISYMALFSLISDLGLSVSHRKIVNEVGADDGICNGTFLFLKTFLNILMVILVILSFSIFENLAQNSSDEHLFRMLFIIFLINKFTTNLFGSLKVIYTTKLEIAISAMPRIFFRFLQMIMKVVISILGFSILYICATEIFIALCILLTYIYFFRNKPLSWPRYDKAREYILFGLPLSLISLLTIISANVDRVTIQYFVGAEEVGIYYLPYTLARPLTLLPAAVVLVIFPILARKISENKLSYSNKLSNLSVKYISLFILPLVAIEFVFSDEILILFFGEDAIASTNVLKFLILGLYIMSIRDPYRLQIISSGKLKYLAIITGIALLSNIILNLFLVPSEFNGLPGANLGAEGAAISTAVSYIILAFLSTFYAKKVTGIRIYRGLWKHIVASIYSVFIGYLILIYLQGVLSILVGSIIMILLFVLVLIILGELTRSDFTLFREALDLSKMYSYINNEIKS